MFWEMHQMYQIKPNIIIDYNNFLVSCVNIEIDTVVMKVVAVLYCFKKLALKDSYNDSCFHDFFRYSISNYAKFILW